MTAIPIHARRWGARLLDVARAAGRQARAVATWGPSLVAEVGGAALAVKGLFELAAWLGWLAAGIAFMVLGWLLEPARRSGR